MSVMVRIPTPLRRMTNGQAKVELESANLSELVDKLNGEDVRFLDGLNTSTNEGDEISIVPAVAGGF